MRMMTYILLGVAGTIAVQRYTEQRPRIQKEIRRMMQQNNRSIQKIRSLL